MGCLLPINCEAVEPKLKKTLLQIYTTNAFTFSYQTPFNSQGKAQTKLCTQCPAQEVNVQWVNLVHPRYYLHNKMCFAEKLCIDTKGTRFGGLRCCRLKEASLKAFETDLHQLVPELPTLKKNLHSKKNELDDALKGPVARAFLYMQLKYHFTIPQSQRLLYERWNRQYPPTKWERQRNQLIKNIQGDSNIYIENNSGYAS